MDHQFSLRPTRWDDLEAVTTLIREVLTADGDAMSAVTSAELEREWKSEGFNLGTDAWVAVTPDGQVVIEDVICEKELHPGLELETEE